MALVSAMLALLGFFYFFGKVVEELLFKHLVGKISIWQTSPMKPFGLGDFVIIGKFLITDSICFLVLGLFRCPVH